MAYDESVVLSLIGDIYDAAQDPALWNRFLDRLAERLPGTKGTFQMIDTTGQRVSQRLVTTSHYGSHFLTDYAAHYDAVNPWIADHAEAAVDKVYPTEFLPPKCDLIGGEFFADRLRPQEPGTGCFGYIMRDARCTMAITLPRPDTEESCRTESQSLLEALLPHIRRAVQMNRRMAVLEQRVALISSALDNIATAIFLTDHRGRAATMNKMAERMIRTDDGLSIRQDRLCAASTADHAALTAMFAATHASACGTGTESRDIMTVARPSGSPAYSVFMCPLRVSPDASTDAPTVAVYVSDPARPSRNRTVSDTLARLFRLTPAEARLGGALAEGLSLTEAASVFGVSVGTARIQLKALFGKTGTHRQAELVRVILLNLAALDTA